MIKKWTPVGRVHHGRKEARCFHLRLGIAQNLCSGAIDEDVLPLFNVEYVHQARRNIDDVSEEAFAPLYRLVSQLVLRHVLSRFRTQNADQHSGECKHQKLLRIEKSFVAENRTSRQDEEMVSK